MKKVSNILEHASNLKNRNLTRKLRVAAIQSLHKVAQDQHGILQHFQSQNTSFPTREHFRVERGGEHDNQKLYGVGVPEYEASDLSTRTFDRSLSTRYSPDRVGVQARRISDGVYQDPITNKSYDWKEGFKTESGEEFHGSGVSLQTNIYSRY